MEGTGRLSQQQNCVTIEHYYRVEIFNAVIDFQLMELNSRFNEQTRELLILSSALDPRFDFQSFDIDKICCLAEKFYPHDVPDLNDLRDQLEHFEYQFSELSEFQDLCTLSELCQEFVNTRTPFMLIERLVRLVMTLPISTATTERAFSAMKLIKNRLRSKMSDDFLADLMTVHIEREIVDTIDSNSVIDEFYASEDASKVGLLKSLPSADTNLLLFKADIYDPNEFEPAIEGCEFVFHVATPMQHDPQNSQYKDTAEAAVAGVRSIADSCIRSQTVKRLIYTASILSMSPRKDDGVGFRPLLDESCWTPLDASSTYGNAITMGYIKSKTLAEKAVLSHNDYDDSKLEVVTLPCGLVGGESLLSYLPTSVGVILAQLTGDLFSCNALKLMQEFMGSVPLVHIDDVCQAHIFCMEQPSMKGRFCCAVACHSIKEIAIYFQETYPEYKIQKKLTEGPEEGSQSDFSKLKKMGFEYKYGMKDILDDSVAWAKKLNGSSLSQVV